MNLKNIFSAIANWWKELIAPKKEVIKDPVVIQPPTTEIPAPEETEVDPIKKEIPDFFFADISHWEPDFDPKKYPAPILINKCTDGLTFIDKTHFKRQKMCKENNIIYMGYHFYQCGKDPILQAQHYLKNHGPFLLNPILDFEEDGDQKLNHLIKESENAYIFMCEVERLTGKTPILYSSIGILKALKLPAKWSRFIIWPARYKNPKLGDIPAPWTMEKNVFAWQFSEDEYMEGIGECDVNIYYGKVNLLNLK